MKTADFAKKVVGPAMAFAAKIAFTAGLAESTLMSHLLSLTFE